jgi:hypothetical protein
MMMMMMNVFNDDADALTPISLCKWVNYLVFLFVCYKLIGAAKSTGAHRILLF